MNREKTLIHPIIQTACVKIRLAAATGSGKNEYLNKICIYKSAMEIFE